MRPESSSKVSRPEWVAVIALLLLAFALRTIDLTRVPPGLHNDEVIETNIAETVAGGRWAIFFPEDTGSEGLHYYFAALFIRLFGDTVYALRLPAMALSLISMCVVWALARRLFGPIVALSALAGFAIVFWPLAFGRIISHTIMEVPVAALSAYFFWRAVGASRRRARTASGRRAWRMWAFSGVWLGLSIYAYTAARILPIIFLAFGAYVWITRRAEWRRWWKGIALTLAVAAVIAVPLAAYLAQHPEVDDLDFFEIDRPLVELQQGNFAPVIRTTLDTLGMFAFTSDPLPYYTVPGRPVFEPVGALLLALGLLTGLRRWRRPEYAFVVLWFFLSLVPGMLSEPAPNSTRTLGAQVVVFMFPGIAIAALLSRRRGAIVYVGLAALFIGNLAWTAHDYFTVWPAIDAVRYWHNAGLKAIADRVQADPDTSPVVLCLPDEMIDERKPWWKPGWQHMRYLLHRPDVPLRYYNCVDAMVFIDGPARYAIPDTSADALDRFPIYAQFLATADPTLVTLPERLGVIARADISTELDPYLVEQAGNSSVAWAPEAGGGSAHLPIDFGGRVEFLGYTLHPSSFILHPSSLILHPSSFIPHPSSFVFRPSSSFTLTTYWRATADLPPQVLQFTHVLNSDGAIIAQQDRLALTSASLRAGDVFAQMHHVQLPDDLAEGEYALSIGLYTAPDGARLPIEQGGRPRGDRLWLQSIEVRK